LRILLGEISSYKAIVITKYIKENYSGITIFTYDFRRYTRYLKTKYSDFHYVLPNKDEPNYLREISKLIKKESIDYFFPVHSDYIGLILKNKKMFYNSLSYLGDFSDYQKLHNKENLLQIAYDFNIRVPRRYIDFEEAKVPFIGKPKEGSSANGVFYFLSDHEKRKYVKKSLKNYIFQEYVNGIGCGYSVYSVNGKIKIGYGHIRLAEYPITGGSSMYRDSFYKQEMYDIAQRILNKIPWTGFAMFEFKLTLSGELVLIEVNPRIWGSINQGLQNGINYFEEILGKSNIRAQKTKNIKTYLSPHIYLSLLLYLSKGKFKPLLNFLRNIMLNKADISLWQDPKGWLSIILRKIL